MPICSLPVTRRSVSTALLLAFLAGRSLLAAEPDPAKVAVLTTPEGGIQPQVAVDAGGVVHLVYFRGEPAAGDLFYTRLEVGSDRFARSIRVNSKPGSAVAMGTIRGAQIAIGRGGRVHIAWNGSSGAMPKNAFGSTPMLYTRSLPDSSAFEPQRNLMQKTSALDGGGSISSDPAGNVYVAWHGRDEEAVEGEEGRRLWIAKSSDDGATFADEASAFDQPTGACACCGTKSLVDHRGTVYVLYRAAKEKVGRDMTLLTSRDRGGHFRGETVHPWRLNACPMSSESLTEGKSDVIAAWETAGQVYFARIDPESGRPFTPISPPGGMGRKHPSVATLADGRTLLAWAEGTAWQKGGSLAWQVFDRDGRPTETNGRLEGGIPVWSLPAVAARRDGSFLIIH